MTHVDPSIQVGGTVLSQSQDVQTHVVLGAPSQAKAEASGAPVQLHGQTALQSTLKILRPLHAHTLWLFFFFFLMSFS